MKKTLSLFLVLVLCACKFLALPLDTPAVDTLTSTANEQFTPAFDAIVNTATQNLPSPTALATQIPFGYIKNCLKIENHAPEDVILHGRIIAKENDLSGLSILSSVIVFPPDEYSSNELSNPAENVLGISPDGQWLVYQPADSLGDFVTIKGFSWVTNALWTTNIPAIPRDKFNWSYWLDNERLLFGFYLDNPIVVNMFTGNTEHTSVRYPEFHLNEEQTLQLSLSLNRMIAYRDLPEEPPSIVLWDLPSKKELRRFYITPEVAHRNLAQVSPNGEQIAVSGSSEPFVDPIFLNLFLLDWDGNVRQQTTLREARLATSLIEQLQWSPDGRYLAFWLNESLAVYDTITQVVTDYCIQSSNSVSFAPHWSPNSQQIVFNGDAPPPGSGPIIIVDVINNTAVEIQENGYYVVGWMSDTR